MMQALTLTILKKQNNLLRADRRHIVCINAYIIPQQTVFLIPDVVVLMVVLMTVERDRPSSITMPFGDRVMK